MTSAIALRRALWILVAGYLSWIGMQAVHEAGHVAAAWLTRGTVSRVELPLLGISRTDVRPNPRPLTVAWAGPLAGAIVPLALTLGFRWGVRTSDEMASAERSSRQLLIGLADFFAGFCLIANGAYIGLGSFGRVGDAGDLLRHGALKWQLVTFGVVAISSGLFIWHLALERSRQQPRGNDPPERRSNNGEWGMRNGEKQDRP